jgi:hypothetical protein
MGFITVYKKKSLSELVNMNDCFHCFFLLNNSVTKKIPKTIRKHNPKINDNTTIINILKIDDVTILRFLIILFKQIGQLPSIGQTSSSN